LNANPKDFTRFSKNLDQHNQKQNLESELTQIVPVPVLVHFYCTRETKCFKIVYFSAVTLSFFGHPPSREKRPFRTVLRHPTRSEAFKLFHPARLIPSFHDISADLTKQPEKKTNASTWLPSLLHITPLPSRAVCHIPPNYVRPTSNISRAPHNLNVSFRLHVP